MPTCHKQLVTLLIFFGLLGCSEMPERASPKNNNAHAFSIRSPGQPNDGLKTGAGIDSTNSNMAALKAADTKQQVPTPNAGTPVQISPADAWCQAAWLTLAAKSAAHTSQLSQLCTPDHLATQRFMDLVAASYSGVGTPNLTSTAPMAELDGVLTFYFGIAQKLPLTSSQQFSGPAIKQGDVNNEKAQIEAMGQTPVTVAIDPTNTDGDPLWARGWNIADDSIGHIYFPNATATYKVTYSYRVDHYDLGSDRYLYVSTLATATATMTDYELFTAGLDLNGTGYLVTIGTVAINDYGNVPVASTNLTSMVQKTVQFIYQNSVTKTP